MSSTRVIILGSGTSHGIPMIGCDCPVCTSPDPRDKRTRTSVVVQTKGRSLLIDTAPELRQQCVACDIRHLDAVLFTHYHADHVAGLDDLRRFNDLQNTALTCYGSAETLAVITQMFPYAFQAMPDYPSVKPRLNAQAIDGPFEISGVEVIPIPLLHAKMPILGFRVGNVAYCTDCNCVPADSMPLLVDLELLILDGLRRRRHPTHFNLEQAVQVAQTIGAKQTLFTHIAHELPHQATNNELASGMGLAYDGQIIQVD